MYCSSLQVRIGLACVSIPMVMLGWAGLQGPAWRLLGCRGLGCSQAKIGLGEIPACQGGGSVGGARRAGSRLGNTRLEGLGSCRAGI